MKKALIVVPFPKQLFLRQQKTLILLSMLGFKCQLLAYRAMAVGTMLYNCCIVFSNNSIKKLHRVFYKFLSFTKRKLRVAG